MQVHKVFATSAQEEQMCTKEPWLPPSLQPLSQSWQLQAVLDWLSFILVCLWLAVALKKISLNSCFLIAQLSHHLSALGHLGGQKISFCVFYFRGSCIWPESWGLVCGASHPRHDVVGGNVGAGVFSPTEAALSETRFLRSKFHYIRGAAGWRRSQETAGIWYWDTIDACWM